MTRAVLTPPTGDYTVHIPMELLSPAGNLEKLATAYRYGADAAYMGVHGFSLRTYADAADLTAADNPERVEELAGELRRIKGAFSTDTPKRLYAALNLFAHHHDITALPPVLERLRHLPIDGLIIADIGLLDMVQRTLPDVELHLSTQANCTNGAAARVYQRLGFSRIVPARELTLDEIKAMKDMAPDMELEVFVHGAMCMAYSGRCFMSNTLTRRDANRGDCAQSCRWNYGVEHFRLEEEKRQGTWIPVEADGRFMTILSARDLNLFDHIEELAAAGVDAVKIEGRMKSPYYVATVTRSYRAALDGSPHRAAYREELFRIAHREYSTGFLLGDETVHQANTAEAAQEYRLMGIVASPVSGDAAEGVHVSVKNTIRRGQRLEYLPPDPGAVPFIRDDAFKLRNNAGEEVDHITNAGNGILIPSYPLQEGTIIRGQR